MTIMCGLDTYLCLAAMTTVHNIAIVACVWEYKHTQSNQLYVANNMVFIYQTTYSWPLYMINTWLYVIPKFISSWIAIASLNIK